MGHSPVAKLSDLKHELDQIRSWESVKEKSPCVFYFKSIPFLHFHVKDEERWADVKTPDKTWIQVPIPFSATVTQRKNFLKAAKDCWSNLRQ